MIEAYDMLGNRFNPRDYVVYPVRSGSNLTMKIGIVLDVQEVKETWREGTKIRLKVQGLDNFWKRGFTKQTKPSLLEAIDRIVIVDEQHVPSHIKKLLP